MDYTEHVTSCHARGLPQCHPSLLCQTILKRFLFISGPDLSRDLFCASKLEFSQSVARSWLSVLARLTEMLELYGRVEGDEVASHGSQLESLGMPRIKVRGRHHHLVAH